MTTISYFFTVQSPWSYIGHAAFTRVAAARGATIDYRPVSLGAIFPATGGLPLAKRHPARQRYRLLELQRWKAKRGLAMNIWPAHWPLDPTLVDAVVIAVAAGGADVEAVLPRFYAGVFEREEDLADPGVIGRVLREAGLDADAILDAARTAAIRDAYDANARLALDAGVVGAPGYVLHGEVFWGQDRLELLDDALATGRAPFSGDV